MQSAYPEAQRILDMPALDLRPFYLGALVRYGGRFHKIADPWRQPLDALAGLLSPTGTLRDKVKIGRLRSRLLEPTPEEIFRQPNIPLHEALHAEGFSPSIIERFLRPFFSGIFLERSLEHRVGCSVSYFGCLHKISPASRRTEWQRYPSNWLRVSARGFARRDGDEH
ncbi:MAG: hypothetical protein LV473_03650 [Nitrospira sp.]|nr:hypothetical protein [Nitrospira sp.]